MSRASLLLLSLLFALPAAADVYQWRDAQGRINYSDTPPTQGNVQTIRKSPRPGAPTTEESKPADGDKTAAEGSADAGKKDPSDKDKSKSDPTKPKTMAEKELEFRQRRAAAAEAEAKAEKQRQEADERKQACERARGQLTALENSRRVTRYNSSGERELIDDASRKTEGERVQKFIGANCK
ncbi:DUF4124 domain-containing protein [Azoarcus sp. KH32C]|uniref:DUF4124 domain-containing protein n=1 Tax=Azoarcus sp. KH32C TaxID=748247 RepID=UPI00023864DB|nr:DUF4124 domain-containing protein [Azoarcus sp. KH32C]BAL24159.1 hypothetical protein AZKH_1846 [Azoarcus sp. KH32C]